MTGQDGRMVEIEPEEDDFATAPVFVDRKLRVLDDKCTTCIFRPGNLMNLAEGVVKEMIDNALNDPTGGGHIPCHDTVYLDAAAICRGFWDGYADRIPLLQVAQRMGLILEVPPPPRELP